MVFQSYALYPHMTVRRNLSFGLENINMPPCAAAAITYGIHPGHVRFVDDADGAIPAIAASIEQLGRESDLYCELPGGQSPTVHHPGQIRAPRGEKIHLRFEAEAAHMVGEDGRALAS